MHKILWGRNGIQGDWVFGKRAEERNGKKFDRAMIKLITRGLHREFKNFGRLKVGKK